MQEIQNAPKLSSYAEQFLSHRITFLFQTLEEPKTRLKTT